MIDKIKGKSLPVVEKYQKTLVSVEHVNEYGIDIIRITIDDPNTFDIDIDDVAAINEEILDLVNDDLPDGYYLEVTTVGIERELKTPMHISACEGWQVEVKLYAPVNGTKVFKGTLCECPEGKIIIENGEGTLEFEAASVAKINTVYDFGADD
jgi:ribosome maturation factor RimP